MRRAETRRLERWERGAEKRHTCAEQRHVRLRIQLGKLSFAQWSAYCAGGMELWSSCRLCRVYYRLDGTPTIQPELLYCRSSVQVDLSGAGKIRAICVLSPAPCTCTPQRDLCPTPNDVYRI